jgi:hypothetical protein
MLRLHSLRTSIATRENVPVIASELHGTHLEIHVPALNQDLIQAINEGQADPMQVLPMLAIILSAH